jgi:hypothetical protein
VLFYVQLHLHQVGVELGFAKLNLFLLLEILKVDAFLVFAQEREVKFVVRFVVCEEKRFVGVF